jgi:tRNA(Arg) A34 adenosine deaminase TadA
MEDIKNKDEAYMRRALMEAQAAFDEDEIPVGAIIVCKDRIISRAHNLTEMLTDVTAHAEMQAITSGANMLEATTAVTLAVQELIVSRSTSRREHGASALWITCRPGQSYLCVDLACA